MNNDDYHKPVIKVKLSSIENNYLAAQRNTESIAYAVLKNNAYGMGIEPTARALERVGCSGFFVDTLDEAITVRRITGTNSEIILLQGAFEKDLNRVKEYDFTVVATNPVSILKCIEAGVKFALNIDVGYGYLGLRISDVKKLIPQLLKCSTLSLLMTQLTNFRSPKSKINDLQIGQFQYISNRLPKVRTSVFTSSYVFSSVSNGFDIVRIGSALWGVGYEQCQIDQLTQTVSMETKVLNIKYLERGQSLGYDDFIQNSNQKVAILGLGYSNLPLDFFRKCSVYIGGLTCRFIGTPSMSVSAIDVSNINDNYLNDNRYVTLIGGRQSLNTIGSHLNMNPTVFLNQLGFGHGETILHE